MTKIRSIVYTDKLGTKLRIFEFLHWHFSLTRDRRLGFIFCIPEIELLIFR